MPRSARALRATFALALTIWTQGCMATRPVASNMELPPGTRVRVRSAVPFTLTREGDTTGSKTAHPVTIVDGEVRRVAGDTLVLERLFSVPTSADGSTFRAQREAVALLRTPATEVTVRSVHWPRTMALIGGITLVVVGFIAYAVSQIEFGFPDQQALSR